jgi:hypothetical protein
MELSLGRDHCGSTNESAYEEHIDSDVVIETSTKYEFITYVIEIIQRGNNPRSYGWLLTFTGRNTCPN